MYQKRTLKRMPDNLCTQAEIYNDLERALRRMKKLIDEQLAAHDALVKAHEGLKGKNAAPPSSWSEWEHIPGMRYDVEGNVVSGLNGSAV